MHPLPAAAALAARSLLAPTYRPSISFEIDAPGDSAVAAAAALVLFRCVWALGGELGVGASLTQGLGGTRKDKLRRKQAGDGLGVGLGVLQTIAWAVGVRYVGPLR